MWKANMKKMKQQKNEAKQILKKQYRKAKEDMKGRFQRQLNIKCEEIKDLNERVDELEDQKWKLNKIVGKYQQEVKQ